MPLEPNKLKDSNMQFIHNKKKLLQLLAEGATVITPNNRLSNALLQEYFRFNQNKTTAKPICVPYPSLLVNSFEKLKFTTPGSSHPTLLNEAQCQHLWRNVIKTTPELTYSEGLLQKIMDAWKHCLQWQIDPKHPDFSYTPQTLQFQHWWTLFNKTQVQLKAINEHQLIPYLLNTQQAFLEGPVVWVCFDDFNPQQLSLQQYFEHQNIHQYQFELENLHSKPMLLAAKDNHEEYQQLMAWLHLKIQENNQTIGVVIPNLEQEYHSLKRMLALHFNEELYDISLGQALSKFPIIAHALIWLNLNPLELSRNQTTLLLQSPYIGSAKTEFIARSQYLQDSRLIQAHSLNTNKLSQDLLNTAPKLALLLKQITIYPQKASLHEWVELFQQRLNLLEFPGDYGLNSENYQCFNRFAALLDELRPLSLISTNLNQNEALDALLRITENTVFQAQKTKAPIQISGLLEASGCEFDSLWVLGLTDQCLPKNAQLSAFIPPQLQRELHMPHSLPLRELQLAKQTLNRLENGSHQTVFSYAKMVGDMPFLPSSLIANYPHFLPCLKDEYKKPNYLVPQEEAYLVPLTKPVSGGSAILSYQAKCPFKAFAQFRLKAEPCQQLSEGLDGKERGILTHKIMELLWKSLSSQDELLRLKDHELEKVIHQSISSALMPLKAQLSELLLEIEHKRLNRLILASIGLEKQRTPFKISALESSYTISLGSLEFSVRVDRLDQVEESKWVIDYKSTIPEALPWKEGRPTEPQLLLYALLDQDINTLLLMQLKTGQIKYKGFSEQVQETKGISNLKTEESWDLYREEWRHQLTLLAEEIQTGVCTPTPQSPALCQNCEFQSLCRYP